jgi:hypothetical protein
MTISMYQASIPTFINGLKNLSEILSKAENYAKEKKIEPSVLINSRLYPDMFPLSRQVQIATDIVKGGVARLAGDEIPSYSDNEASFSELQERISKTIKYIESFKASQIDGTEDKAINFTVGKVEVMELNFTGQQYLLYWILPNFYFHITTTYAILRHNGLDIGKADFLGKM